MEQFQTAPPRVVYHDLSRFIPMDQLGSVEEWQIRKLDKQRATQMEQIESLLSEKFDEFQSTAAAAAAHNAVPVDESISHLDVGGGVDDEQLQLRILQLAASAAGPERLSMDDLLEEPIDPEFIFGNK